MPTAFLQVPPMVEVMTTESERDLNPPISRESIPGLSDEESRKAAELIQRTFRGYRTRRELKGFGLDPTTRWLELVKAAKYQKTTEPKGPDDPVVTPTASSPARARWQKVTEIAKHAGYDDISPETSDVSLSDASDSDDRRTRTSVELQEYKKRKAEATEKRKRTAKMMDLQYFLEMVDQKHRYGSSLRKYHAYWKTQDTNQNFFYWLDYGEGKDVELEECSRARLDREQVRYLSREERLQYLVKVDPEGNLIWAKNGRKVWTKDELYKDSINGIVPTNDPSPPFKYNQEPRHQPEESTSSDSSDDDPEDERKNDELEGEHYADEAFHRAKGPAKLKHVSAGVLFNHMIRSSVKKGHKWIFVCDTSFRLYIGYKQSGSFQHSSFLHGSRILSAGIIKVKDGQLRRLSPLSGHYRPRAQNFRAFVHSLQEEGVDMSHVSISRSYAVLVGLEGYTKTRQKIKSAERSVKHGADKIVRPEKVKEEELQAQDKSESARKEREYLERQRSEGKGPEKTHSRGLSQRLSQAWGRVTGKTTPVDHHVRKQRRTPGTGPEDGIPAPDGKVERRLEQDK